MYTVPKLEDFSPAALDAAAAELLAALRSEAESVSGAKAFEEFRNRWMARKNGLLTQVNDLWLKAAPGPAKRDVGQRVNALKQQAEALVSEAEASAACSALEARLNSETLDISLPGIERPLG